MTKIWKVTLAAIAADFRNEHRSFDVVAPSYTQAVSKAIRLSAKKRKEEMWQVSFRHPIGVELVRTDDV